MDQRLVQQFDRMQGFSCIVERLANQKNRDDAEELYDALLSLIFWRRQVIYICVVLLLPTAGCGESASCGTG